MIEQKLKVLSESLARGIDRRNFLRGAGTAIFGGVAALAAGHAGKGALAAGLSRGGKDSAVPDRPRCAPPGPYCNIDGISEPTGCNGAQCYRHLSGGTMYMCKVYYTYYQSGCWTTVDGNGYWTCCDCRCTNGATCGCASYSRSPIPLPSGQNG